MKFRLFSSLLYLSIFLVHSSFAQVGSPKKYKNGLVVSANKEASEAGIEILKLGGNAVDAAVAVHFALAVTFPAAGNLGGGGFMVARFQNGEVKTIDFREKAPAKASKDMYLDAQGNVTDKSVLGHWAVGVPGSVDGALEALERYGTMPVDMVIEPAIRLARKGFHLTYEEASSLNHNKEVFSQFPSTKKYFVKADGSEYVEGELFVQEDLAQTLERIAQFGRDGFYSGVTAELITKEMKKNGGLVDLNDLKAYKSAWREPVKMKYKEYELVSMGPPSSGGIGLSQMLSMIEPYNIGNYGWNSSEAVHVMAEAMKRAYADRSKYVGDPDFVNVPTAVITNRSYSKNRMNSFNWAMATPSNEIAPGSVPFFKESDETTHFSVVDKFGNAVAITTTLNSGYGSKVVVDGAGFFLNNEMDDFSSKPGVPNQFGLTGGKANAIAPHKRMVSSMTPTIVTKNGKLNMVLGTPGGSTIITTVLQVFINGAEFGMNAQQAVAAPRVHHQWLPDELYFEKFALSRYDYQQLQARGYTLSERKGYSGRADVIFIDENGILSGGADPRGFDYAAGY
ncbi:gamma-glutamyltransferase [bacterium]|nr:MAG: gamma-glutamyltransferase [bacterium]